MPVLRAALNPEGREEAGTGRGLTRINADLRKGEGRVEKRDSIGSAVSVLKFLRRATDWHLGTGPCGAIDTPTFHLTLSN